MKLEKKYEIAQKRIVQLNERVEFLSDTLEQRTKECKEAVKLANRLQGMFFEWKDIIDDLKDKQREYDALISQVKVLKSTMEK